MNTEREQLTLAAKACGIELVWAGDSSFCFIPSQKAPQNRRAGDEMQGVVWNPLKDDGDCARMEAQLGIELTWFFDRVDALACDVAPVVEYFKDHAGDKNAARRVASVAVAAEIGRLM